jgi:hypothetical protein
VPDPGGFCGAHSSFREPARNHRRGSPLSHLGSHRNSRARGPATDTHRDACVESRPLHPDFDARGGLADALRDATAENVIDGLNGPGYADTSGDLHEAFGALASTSAGDLREPHREHALAAHRYQIPANRRQARRR